MAQNYQYGGSPGVPSRIGTLDSISTMFPGHPTFPFRRASGVVIGGAGWEHVIAVNQVGKRFYNERAFTRAGTRPVWGANPVPATGESHRDYVQGDWRNGTAAFIRENYNRESAVDAAIARNEGSSAPHWGSGPSWAIFDSAAVERGGWDIGDPYTGDPQAFVTADTIRELAQKVMAHPHARVPMRHLEETVERWNAFVEAGHDDDFEKDGPLHRIDTPPFYAAAITVANHDSNGGLKINGRAQVIDTAGNVIPGLFAGGEASGGGDQHGLGRALVHGFIAGTNAATS
jgi:hypothetical protein